MQDVEDDVAEKRDKKHGHGCEDRAENLSVINLRPAERAEQPNYQKRAPNSKKQKIRPRKIPRRWKPREEPVGEQPGDYDNEADPDRPVPLPVHVGLVAHSVILLIPASCGNG